MHQKGTISVNEGTHVYCRPKKALLRPAIAKQWVSVEGKGEETTTN